MRLQTAVKLPCLANGSSIPYRAQLWVAQGNRVTGEYVVDGPIDLTEPYREEIVIPRDENGDPLLVDKIYLYSYQQGDGTQRYAASLYIDYENYLAARPVPAAAKRSVPSGNAVPVVAIGVACAALASGVAVAIKRKKRKSTAVAPAAPEECDLMAQGCEMLEQLKEESKGLQDEAVSEKAALLCRLLSQQLEMSKENPQRLSGMRKMITYYLPVALKLLKFWRSNEQQDVDEDKRADAFASVAGGLDMIIDAFRKKLNNLHDAEMMDVSAELSALDQMLKREGLKDHRLKLTLGETKKD